MLCEPTSSDNEEKEGYDISGNHLINLKTLTTNTENILVLQQCANEKDAPMKLEEKRYQENLISYVEAYYEVTPTCEQKGIRQLHHDFNRKV